MCRLARVAELARLMQGIRKTALNEICGLTVIGLSCTLGYMACIYKISWFLLLSGRSSIQARHKCLDHCHVVLCCVATITESVTEGH